MASELPVEEVVRRLHDVRAWADRLDGWIGTLSHGESEGELRLEIPHPRSSVLRLRYAVEEAGITFAMIEGDFAALDFELIAEASPEGATRVRWDARVDIPFGVPNTLRLELEQRVMPAVARRIVGVS